MQSISTIGLDVAKSVFQVHGVDATGQIVIRRQLRHRHTIGHSISISMLVRLRQRIGHQRISKRRPQLPVTARGYHNKLLSIVAS